MIVPKFKVGDTVKVKKLPDIVKKLKDIGVYLEHYEDLLNKYLIITNIDTSMTEDDLPYEVAIDENKTLYFPSDLLELAEVPTNSVSTTENSSETIKIKYHEPIAPLENINGANSDWIDLRCAEPNGIDLKAGEFKLISLGVSMKLPDGYEAHIVPRSSTFKNYGILQTNSQAVIDNSYCSDTDLWKYPVYATRDTHIDFNDRICQFRIMKKQPTIHFEVVEHLDGKARGGFGSSGVK